MWIADDTIVAVSTPAGRGGLGIVRLSGAAAKAVAERLVQLKRPLEPGRVRFAEVMDAAAGAETGAATVVLDQAVVSWFKGPRSYTGEDVVEIAVHGAPVLLDAMVRRCVAAGARLARPGEFTERAFLAGRIDLTQAEAVDDLIQATTLEQARTAARQMGGGLSRQIKPVKARLVELIAGMEAGIDFAEDDLDVVRGEVIWAELRGIEAALSQMEESFAYGRVLREGFRLAIVGRPNAGKSSLFNRLVRRDRAIVTAQPGTTRDPVAERLEIAGIPVEVVDTAGLRVATDSGADLDEAEAMGVAKSREVMAEADVVLLVVAADELWKDGGFLEEDLAVMRGVGGTRLSGSEAQGSGLVVVVNKVDLVRGESGGGLGDLAWEGPTSQKRDVGHAGSAGGSGLEAAGGVGDAKSFGVLRLRAARFAQDGGREDGVRENGLVVVETSAVDGTGIEELRAAVLGQLKAIAPEADTAPVTNLRQHEAVAAAARAVRAAIVGVEQAMPHEMVLIDLHEALEALDGLTGTTHTEEILGIIFSRFCVGK